MRLYIAVILVTILIVGCINKDKPINDIETEEYTVYSTMINKEFDTFIIVIKDRTVCEPSSEKKFSETLPGVYQDIRGADKEAFDDSMKK